MCSCIYGVWGLFFSGLGKQAQPTTSWLFLFHFRIVSDVQAVFWRVTHACGLIYLGLLIFLLFQNLDDARQLLKVLQLLIFVLLSHP